MKLHSPKFEKVLREGVRRALRASPQLKRDSRHANRRRHHSLGILGRPLLCVLLAMAIWWLGSEQRPVQSALAAIALWTFGLLPFQVNSLLSLLYAAPDLPAFSVLPATGSTVFRWEFQKFLRRSAWVFVDVLLACSVLAWLNQFTFAKWLMVIPVTLLAGLTSLSLAMVLAARWPHFPYPMISLALWLLLIAGLVLRGLVGPILLDLLNRSAPWLLLILPTGWPVSLLELCFDSRHALNLSLIVPIALVLLTLKPSLARLREHYDFTEVTVPEPPDLLPDVEPESPQTGAVGSFPRRIGPTEIEDIVRSRQFLAQPRWQERGWLERLLWRWLNPRERNLVEMVFPEGPVLSKPWFGVFRLLLIGWLATWVSLQFVPALTVWVLGGSLLIAAIKALLLVLRMGAVFRPVPCGGVNIPFHAAFPVGFKELSRLLVKYSAVQLPALVLFAGTGGALVTSILAQAPWTLGFVIGSKTAFLLFALRFIASVFSLSSVTNDTARLRIRSIALVLFMVAAGLGFLVLAGAGLAIPHAGFAWLSVVCAMLVSYGAFRIYAWQYDANRFDLMNVPRQ